MSFKMARMRAGKSQTEVAFGTGIHIGVLSKIENGWRAPSDDHIALLLEYFGCTRDELLAENDEPHLIPLHERGKQ